MKTEQASYRPKQRTARARFLTPLGWLDGTMHMPERTHLVDFLTHAASFLSLTDVVVEETADTLAHFALQHHAIRLVVPVDHDPLVEPAPPPEGRRHRVLVALEQGAIDGVVVSLHDARVSDHFTHRRGFFTVHDANVRVVGRGAMTAHLPVVLVFADHVLGIADRDDAGAA